MSDIYQCIRNARFFDEKVKWQTGKSKKILRRRIITSCTKKSLAFGASNKLNLTFCQIILGYRRNQFSKKSNLDEIVNFP